MHLRNPPIAQKGSCYCIAVNANALLVEPVLHKIDMNTRESLEPLAQLRKHNSHTRINCNLAAFTLYHDVIVLERFATCAVHHCRGMLGTPEGRRRLPKIDEETRSLVRTKRSQWSRRDMNTPVSAASGSNLYRVRAAGKTATEPGRTTGGKRWSNRSWSILLTTRTPGCCVFGGNFVACEARVML